MKPTTLNQNVVVPSRSLRETDKLASTLSKYRNVKTEVDGYTFDSKREAARYGELKLLERAGEIRDLRLQVRMPLEINGMKVCTYICDFHYFVFNKGLGFGKWVYEDVKGKRTPVYLLKKKLVKAILGVDILET